MTAMDWATRAACRDTQEPDLFFPAGDGEPEDWRGQALCAEADPEAWFPEQGGTARQAKAICRRCPVTAECLEYALEHDERFGVWAGTTPDERRSLKRLRAGEAAA